ncbi:hypothetical protein Hypma_005088 [Hypsizygus marmoreus]|uniref:Secreted protein n=1 Tax=Hypsizygus marmoreus TaxID=39966 RepID=A0A369K2K1_HYPMA|nr:hypothetical protein Hypma_005088 [Hypsizygus marmoreus]
MKCPVQCLAAYVLVLLHQVETRLTYSLTHRPPAALVTTFCSGSSWREVHGKSQCPSCILATPSPRTLRDRMAQELGGCDLWWSPRRTVLPREPIRLFLFVISTTADSMIHIPTANCIDFFFVIDAA